jgi:N-carbamoylputrescine amidase
MAETPTLLKIGLAQIDGRLGDVERNAGRHLDWIVRAREAGVDLLVFPELSLTGYRLLHLTPRVALPLGSPVLARLAEAAGPMRVVVGFVEEGERGILHNSAVLLAGGKPELARRLAVAGTKLLIVVSAAPGRIGSGSLPESHESWELLTRSTALLDTCWVAYCNRVGWEEGSFYPGGSHVVRPGGEIAGRAPMLEEHLLVAEIDLRDSDRLRWRLPLLDDERSDVEGPAA